jgi:hypothetical protein
MYELIQRLERVTADIEGAVEGDAERARRLHQRPRACHVQRAIRLQQADHDPVGSVPFGRFDVVFHDLEFQIGVAEVAATRPDDDVEVYVKVLARERYGTRAGCCAALEQVVA